MAEAKEWFDEWFDSPYYHVLYKHRDYEEARLFIDHLVQELQICKQHRILDLACGKGRHAIYLNKKGFDVVGVDLSEQNIQHAQQYENDRLHFYVHDMRHPLQTSHYDFVLNLFTSFGYFDSVEENAQAIEEVSEALRPGGRFVLDFLNPYTVIHQLKPAETKIVEGVSFDIGKTLSEEGYIIKDIRFTDKGEDYHFQERVKAIRYVEFLDYFRQAGLMVEEVYGDYNLHPYKREESDRMIFVVSKPE